MSFDAVLPGKHIAHYTSAVRDANGIWWVAALSGEGKGSCVYRIEMPPGGPAHVTEVATNLSYFAGRLTIGYEGHLIHYGMEHDERTMHFTDIDGFVPLPGEIPAH